MPDCEILEVRARSAIRTANTLFDALKAGEAEPIIHATNQHAASITALDAAVNDDGA